MYKIIYNKCKYFIIIIFLITYSTPADGMVKYSFRMRGLGTNLFGFVDDMYSDLYFNPAYISRYKSKYIYTNLSNLQGQGKETIFGQNNSEINKNGDFPSNLFGIIGGFEKSNFGIFVETSGHSFKLTDELGYENFQAGTALRTHSTKTLEGDFKGKGLTYIGMFRDIGYFISIDKLGMNLNWSTTNDTTSTEIPTEVTKFTSKENSELKFPNSNISFALGKIYKSEKREISISGGMMPQRLGINLDEVFPVLKKPFIQEDEEEFGDFDKNNLGYMELGIKSYFLNFRYKNINSGTNKFHQNNYLFNYTRYMLPIDISVNSSSITDSITTDVDGDILSRQNDITADNVSGDGSAGINSLTFGYGTERHFDGLKSMAAVGLKFQYMWGSFELDQGPGERIEESHQFFEGNDSTMYKNVFNDNKVTATRGDANLLMVSIPIGLEMKFTNKLTFRIGANAAIPISFNGSWNKTVSDSTNSLVSSAGQGQSYIPDVESEFTEEKVSELKGKFINLRSYHFGASYKFSDSINIDFLNFADVTNLKTWWLSVVIKF